MAEQWVGLADAIRALRAELTTAMTEGAGESLRFELGPVEMEFLLEVGREASGEAGVKFWVISLGGKGSVNSGSTHRVTLSLTPKDRAGRRITATAGGPDRVEAQPPATGRTIMRRGP